VRTYLINNQRKKEWMHGFSSTALASKHEDKEKENYPD
jgi:hypothetical protein